MYASQYLTFIHYRKYQQITSNDAVLLNWSDNVCPVKRDFLLRRTGVDVIYFLFYFIYFFTDF